MLISFCSNVIYISWKWQGEIWGKSMEQRMGHIEIAFFCIYRLEWLTPTLLEWVGRMMAFLCPQPGWIVLLAVAPPSILTLESVGPEDSVMTPTQTRSQERPQRSWSCRSISPPFFLDTADPCHTASVNCSFPVLWCAKDNGGECVFNNARGRNKKMFWYSNSIKAFDHLLVWFDSTSYYLVSPHLISHKLIEAHRISLIAPDEHINLDYAKIQCAIILYNIQKKYSVYQTQ